MLSSTQVVSPIQYIEEKILYKAKRDKETKFELICQPSYYSWKCQVELSSLTFQRGVQFFLFPDIKENVFAKPSQIPLKKQHVNNVNIQGIS